MLHPASSRCRQDSAHTDLSACDSGAHSPHPSPRGLHRPPLAPDKGPPWRPSPSTPLRCSVFQFSPPAPFTAPVAPILATSFLRCQQWISALDSCHGAVSPGFAQAAFYTGHLCAATSCHPRCGVLYLRWPHHVKHQVIGSTIVEATRWREVSAHGDEACRTGE